jgi:hypothetical protein
MRNSWTQTFRRLAAACTVAGATAISSAMCYAQIASDSASDPVYADGWQAGDNGGHGFTPWNFDSDTIFSILPGIQDIDDGLQTGTNPNSNPFNNIGQAWHIALPTPQGALGGLPRAGRGFAPLQPGETLSMIVDNPTVRQFFKGYFIRFSDGPGNICYGSTPCTLMTSPSEKVSLSEFEYFSYGNWHVNDDAGGTATTLFDTDTAAAGMKVDFTLLTSNTYEVVMDPLGPAPSYSQTGYLRGKSGEVDWVEFTFFNTPTDTGTPPPTATDFYVSSMSITPEPGTAALILIGAGGALLGTARRRSDE